MKDESYYRTLIDSPQWQLWVKKNEEAPRWDVYESMELGIISEGHLQAFFNFVKTL